MRVFLSVYLILVLVVRIVQLMRACTRVCMRIVSEKCSGSWLENAIGSTGLLLLGISRGAVDRSTAKRTCSWSTNSTNKHRMNLKFEPSNRRVTSDSRTCCAHCSIVAPPGDDARWTERGRARTTLNKWRVGKEVEPICLPATDCMMNTDMSMHA